METEKINQQLIKLLSHHFPTLTYELPQLLNNTEFDRALGCVYGSFIGDALGSLVEFTPVITQQMMDKVMKMEGGGQWNVFPGQLTDDSQLALCMGFGLCSYDGKLPIQKQTYQILKNIALQYSYWFFEGDAFDLGQTTKSARDVLKRIDTSLPSKVFIQTLHSKLNETQLNKTSCSNGSLMRIVPMCVFRSLLPNQQIQTIIRSETNLTHSNPLIIDAIQIWVNMIGNIINRRGDNQLGQIYHNSIKGLKKGQQLFEWVQQSKKSKIMNKEDLKGKNIGWTKVAWSQGYHYLRKIIQNPTSLNYKNIQRQIIFSGGDTDTNACIVGGLLGSILGITKLPIDYIKKSLEVDVTKTKVKRQIKYHPREGFNIVYKLFKQFKKI